MDVGVIATIALIILGIGMFGRVFVYAIFFKRNKKIYNFIERNTIPIMTSSIIIACVLLVFGFVCRSLCRHNVVTYADIPYAKMVLQDEDYENNSGGKYRFKQVKKQGCDTVTSILKKDVVIVEDGLNELWYYDAEGQWLFFKSNAIKYEWHK